MDLISILSVSRDNDASGQVQPYKSSNVGLNTGNRKAKSHTTSGGNHNLYPSEGLSYSGTGANDRTQNDEYTSEPPTNTKAAEECGETVGNTQPHIVDTHPTAELHPDSATEVGHVRGDTGALCQQLGHEPTIIVEADNHGAGKGNNLVDLARQLRHRGQGLREATQQLSDSRRENKTLIQQVLALQQTGREQQEDIDSLFDMARKKWVQLADKREKLAGAEHTINQQKAEIESNSDALRKAQQRTNELQQQVDAIQGQLLHSNELLQERTKELKMVNAFISRANTHSNTELKTMVEMLNQEISQVCSAVIETLDFNPSIRSVISGPLRDDLLSDSDWLCLPRHFIRLVSTHVPLSNDDEIGLMGVTILLQAVIVRLVYCSIQMWYPWNRTVDQLLQNIYHGLCASDSLTALQWKALAYRQLLQSSEQEPQSHHDMLSSVIQRALYLCGWSDEYLLQNKHYSQAIGQGLCVIVNKSLQLRKVILEGMVQSEARVLWLPGGWTFDDSLADDAAFRPDRNTSLNLPNRRILCTMDLGLCITSLTSENSITILKVGVVMEDVVLKDVEVKN